MKHKHSLSILLGIVFLDYMGIGLIFPIFSSLLFNPASNLLPLETSAEARGLWLGFLIAAMPIAQFFSAPIWGTLSDTKGRKRPLLGSLIIGSIGYLLAAGSCWINSLFGLFLSRFFIGFAAGNMAIVQAAIADISHKEHKTKNYGLYSMACGSGFTFGPLIGGILSSYGYAFPFFLGAFFCALNVIFLFFFFKETHFSWIKKKIHLAMALFQLKKAFKYKGLKTVLLCSFLGVFGWVYFFEFVSVYLITKFHFSVKHLGLFFGVAGGMYALSSGILIRPLIKSIKPLPLFVYSMLCTGLIIVALCFVPNSIWIWPLIFLICYVTAPFSPTSTALVSDGVSSEMQGEALGVLGSINAAAFALAPLFSGAVVGNHPALAMWIGGSLMFLGGLIGGFVFKQKINLR